MIAAAKIMTESAIRKVWLAMLLFPLTCVAGGVSAETVQFSNYAAPQIPAKTGTVKVGAVTLTGGALSNGYSQPWNCGGCQQVVYSTVGPCPGCAPKCPGCAPTNCDGCAVECAGCLPSITIDFSREVWDVGISIQTRTQRAVTYYYQDDRGWIQTLTMGGQNTVRNLFYGAHDESRRIRRVTIFTYDPQWDFAIYWVTVRFPGGGAIDPWPQFTSGNKVLADPASLALADSTTYAIAADGVARLVLRLGAATVGERFTVTLYDTCCESTPSVAAESGTLTTLDNQDSPAQQLTVAAVDTDIGPMAFAVYRAPPDFSRSGRDDNSGLRMVNIHAASDAGTSGTDIVLYIVRPPVVLVHGLWGSEDDWKAFTLLKNDPLRQFFTKPVDYAYRFETQVLTGTVPAYSAESRGLIKGNALGFDFAAPVVLQQITQKLMDFRLQNGAAVAQADVIAHSMGGTITRTLINLPRYATSETYGMGFVHKLITIGTPHSGSQLAADMLDDANRCFRELLAGKGNAAVASATFGIAGDYSGGARDLSPGSDALGRMQRGNGPLVPTALVAAVTTATNTATLDCTLCVPGILRSSSRLGCPSDPVVKRFTSQLWNTEFRGEQNDGVVALSSQLAGLSASPGANPVIGVIHSSGLGRLGFTGPAEQESAAIQTLMIVLLNESTNGPDFHLGLLN